MKCATSLGFDFRTVFKLDGMARDNRWPLTLKWPGGKGWLATGLTPLLKRELGLNGRYIEPFIGGGAVFFQMRPDRSLLSDVNSSLIEFYEILRDDPEALVRAVWRFSNDAETYYRVRESEPSTALGRAARFLFLNRTCWGGIYRVNKNGIFNVPFGGSGRIICRKSVALFSAESLRQSKLRVCDFEKSLNQADFGDVVYLDPPYSLGFGKDCFNRYQADSFEWNDHLRLVSACKRASKRGVFICVSAAMHRDLLASFDGWVVASCNRRSHVGRVLESRMAVKEAILFSRMPREWIERKR